MKLKVLVAANVVALAALAGTLLGSPVIAKDPPPPQAQGVHTALQLAEYPLPGQPTHLLACGDEIVTQTWVVAKLAAWADVPGVANVQVNSFYGDEVLPPGQDRQPKHDRLGIKDYPLTTRLAQIGDLAWFNDPGDRGEAYTWQFDVVAGGQLQSTCEITVTRI